MDPEAFVDAVAGSGYPLQMYAAALLRDQGFRIQEEWAYTDADAGKRRAIDVFAFRVGQERRTDKGSTAMAFDLLIECKQSRHPFVFFQAVDVPSQAEYPTALFGHLDIIVGPRTAYPVSPDDNWATRLPLGQLLDIDGLPFIADTPVASSMSVARPQNKRVAMSGDDAYRELVLPLTKAIAAHRSSVRARMSKDEDRQLIRLPLVVALLDAPIFLVSAPDAAPQPVNRLRLFVRPAVDPDANARRPATIEFVEVVAKRAFSDFLVFELNPFLLEYHRRVAAHHSIVLGGRAEIPGLLRGQDLRHLLNRLAAD